MKALKYLIFILIISVGLLYGFSLLRPKKFESTKKLIQNFIQNKILPFSGEEKGTEKKILKETQSQKKPTPKQIPENQSDTFTNHDLFEAICEQELKSLPQNDTFQECQTCPKYTQAMNENSIFQFNYGKRGFYTNKNEEQALVFMSGCSQQVDQDGFVLLLKKGFGGWQKKNVFPMRKITHFPPLLFKDQDNRISFIAKKKFNQSPQADLIEYNEAIVYLNFLNNTMNEQTVLVAKTITGNSCEDTLSSALGEAKKDSETQFKINIEITPFLAQEDSLFCSKLSILRHPNYIKLPCLGNTTLAYELNENNIFLLKKEFNFMQNCLEKI
ncbi:MAG: hypothetical protein K2X39_01130 [Silvanigrellaceae bacterium]|nr:hypothetical protein [Silvanigrellaceae bacterium]